MQKQYVFGYGSLVSVDSVFHTLGRRVNLIYPVELRGWVRDWSVVIDATTSHRHAERACRGEVPAYIAALNVRLPRPGEPCTNPNGVVFEVTDTDLRRLDARESHYRRDDVTAHIARAPSGVIYTYIGLDRHLDDQNPELPAVIPSAYMDVVASGFAELAPDAHDLYLSSTRASDLPVFREAVTAA